VQQTRHDIGQTEGQTEDVHTYRVGQQQPEER
jgi:hypothetical protein